MQGINDWNSFLNVEEVSGISKKRKIALDLKIKNFSKALMDDDVDYFSSKLKRTEHWRLYPEFKDSCIFLDIETSSVNGYITCMTLYDGYDTMTFVKDINMDLKQVKYILSRYKMIITFNGNVFDLPFLRKYLGKEFKALTWDLRHSCARLGLKGGLKEIEKTLGISRNNVIVERMHGGDPFKLWKMYKATGDRYYLELLVEYNQEDSLNLHTIVNKIYPRLVQQIRNQ